MTEAYVKICYNGRLYGPIYTLKYTAESFLSSLNIDPYGWCVRPFPRDTSSVQFISIYDILEPGIYELFRSVQYYSPKTLKDPVSTNNHQITLDSIVHELSDIIESLENLQVHQRFSNTPNSSLLSTFIDRIQQILSIVSKQQELSYLRDTVLQLLVELRHIQYTPITKRVGRVEETKNGYKQSQHLLNIKSLNDRLQRSKKQNNIGCHPTYLLRHNQSNASNKKKQTCSINTTTTMIPLDKAKRDFRIRLADSLILTQSFSDKDMNNLISTLIELEVKRNTGYQGSSLCHGSFKEYPAREVKQEILKDFNINY